MKKEVKCPNCKKSNQVYPSNNPTLGAYICMRCFCVFDNIEKHKDKNDIRNERITAL